MSSLPVTPNELLLASAIVTAGSLVQGSAGFGAALVASPLLLLIDRSFVPGPILVAGLVLTLLMSLREREHVDRRGAVLAITGRVVSTVPAAYAVAVLSDQLFSIAFASLVLFAVALSLAGWHVAATPRNVMLAGAVSGVTSVFAAIGGPPMALIYQHAEGNRFRGTLSVFFFIGSLISIHGLWYVNRFGAVDLALGGLLIPGTVLGYALSFRVAPWLDAGRTRVAVLWLSSMSAIAVLLRAFS